MPAGTENVDLASDCDEFVAERRAPVEHFSSCSAPQDGPRPQQNTELVVGMMLGDLTIGRYAPTAIRDRLIEPLRLLLAVPYLALLLSPPPLVVALLAFAASAGYGASLPLQDRLLHHTDEETTGQALGLYSQGMMVWQAVGAGIAGGLATYFSPAHAMGLMAVGSLTVTLMLARGLQRSRLADRQPVPPVGT